MSERDMRLQQFFGGYFNQDWNAFGATTWRDVLVQYVKESTRAQVLAIRDDLQSWLQETAANPAAAQQLPAAFACDYDPSVDGVSGREWARQIADFLQRQLTN